MFRDLVVLIPGILGSALEKDGEELWGLSASTLFKTFASLGTTFDTLKLVEDDHRVDDIGDGIEATRLLPDLHMLPGLWKIDGYQKARVTIVEKLGLSPGENYFELPYDWRRDIRVAARKLDREAQGWLTAWRTKSGNADARLVLLAHSMGGLVARHFIEVLGGWSRTKALITFGTPFRGSPKALGALANGVGAGIAGHRIADISDAVASFTSVYQLLPTYKCFIGPDLRNCTRVGETPDIPNVSFPRAADALRFHQAITEAQAINASIDGYSAMRLIPLVGVEQPTAVFARRSQSGVELRRRHAGQDLGGDTTVPRISAIPAEFVGDATAVFFADAHASLQNADAVLTHLCAALKGAAIDYSRFRAHPASTLGLDIDDVYPQERDLELRATSSEYRPFIDVIVTDVDGGGLAYRGRLSYSTENVDWRGPIRLPPGAYRVEAKADGAQTVTDVFAVV